MIFYDSGIPIDTIQLDETQAQTFGSFKDVGLSGFISSFSQGIDIYVGVVDIDGINDMDISHKELPQIFYKDQYIVIPNSDFSNFSEEFFGASAFFEGPDKNYYYNVGKQSVFDLHDIYLAQEAVFKGSNGMDEVTIFEGDFSAVLFPDIINDSSEVDIPDSIQLHISSVKGFIHNGL